MYMYMYLHVHILWDCSAFQDQIFCVVLSILFHASALASPAGQIWREEQGGREGGRWRKRDGGRKGGRKGERWRQGGREEMGEREVRNRERKER